MTPLVGTITRLIVGVRAQFGGGMNSLSRPLVVSLVNGDEDRGGGVYLRGRGKSETSSRFISWRNAVHWAHKPDGKVARGWRTTMRETNPEYVVVYADTVRSLKRDFPDSWARMLAVLGLKPPGEGTGAPAGSPSEYAAEDLPAEAPDVEDPDLYTPKWTPKPETPPEEQE